MAEVNVNLLSAMVQVIDVASSKGAFVGGDITAAGQIREQLVAIVREEMPEQTVDQPDEQPVEDKE